MKMYYGPRSLIINSNPLNKRKEPTIMEKLQTFEAPPIILAATNKIEKAVADWYEKHSKKKLTVQTKQEPLEFMPPAPPVIGGTGE